MLAVLLTYVPQYTTITITGITHHIIDAHNPVTTKVECIRSYKRVHDSGSQPTLLSTHGSTYNTKYDNVNIKIQQMQQYADIYSLQNCSE